MARPWPGSTHGGHCRECGKPSPRHVCDACIDAVQWPEPDPEPDPDTWGALIRAERAARGA